MDLKTRITQLIAEAGIGYIEKGRTIYTTCPMCGREDKFSILKANGACVCYHGSCEFGKRWFTDWLALTLKIPINEAKHKLNASKEAIYEPNPVGDLSDIVLSDDVGDLNPAEMLMATIKEVQFPEFHMTAITSPESKDGLDYLISRGVSVDIAAKYQIHYSKLYRRVYFPVIMDGKIYGYQGRHIDKVDSAFRIRNNEGFRRETLVMFADNLIGQDFAVLAEGPFDAIKFDLVGANICPMGKVVTDKQLAIIESYGITKLYLALDDDAASEMGKIVEKVKLKVFKVSVPKTCLDRCKVLGKKADFGECTLLEAKQAFLDAKPVDMTSLLVYVE